MLSIIIPSYNYPVYDLVKELHSQCSALAIAFEIIVRDDCSKNQYKNFNINQLTHCSYSISNKNLGRSKTRNYLISQAQYPWVLLLDNDVLPQKVNFIQNYLDAILPDKDIYFGGIIYKKESPDADKKLRWIYGTAREEKPAALRNTNCPDFFLCSNTLFSKSIFNTLLFDEEIINYGYEDLLFNKQAVQQKFGILQLDNNVWHLKLETSNEYLAKTKTALQTLYKLINDNKLEWSDTKITSIYIKMKQKRTLGFLRTFNKWFKLSEKLEKNLLSNHPKIQYFDLYRLLYFDKLYTKNT